MSRRTGKVAKDPFDLCRQPVVGLGEPLLEQRKIGLVAAGKIGRHEIVLALEMIVERPLGDAGLRRHGVDAHAPDAVSIEELARRRNDAFACRGPRSCHARKYTSQ
jgi:hypothetical protein